MSLRSSVYWTPHRAFSATRNIDTVQLTPTLTNFKGPITFICYRRISVISNTEKKGKYFKGLNNNSAIGGFLLLAGFNFIYFKYIMLANEPRVEFYDSHQAGEKGMVVTASG